MTDAEYREQKKRIRRLAARWLDNLGLRCWKLTIRVDREPLGDTDSWPINAMVEVRWEYLIAEMAFSGPEIMKLNDEELEQSFLHECAHVLICEMREYANQSYDQAKKHEERVAVTLARAFAWIRRDALKGKTK